MSLIFRFERKQVIADAEVKRRVLSWMVRDSRTSCMRLIVKQSPYIVCRHLQLWIPNVCVRNVGQQVSFMEHQPRFTTLLISAWTGTDGAGSERSHLDAPVRPCRAPESTCGVRESWF